MGNLEGPPNRFSNGPLNLILSGQKRCDEPRLKMVNGLACFTLRGDLRPHDVRLNGADGFAGPTVCQCDFIFPLDKAVLHSNLGVVAWERQLAIKTKLREVLRL